MDATSVPCVLSSALGFPTSQLQIIASSACLSMMQAGWPKAHKPLMLVLGTSKPQYGHEAVDSRPAWPRETGRRAIRRTDSCCIQVRYKAHFHALEAKQDLQRS